MLRLLLAGVALAGMLVTARAADQVIVGISWGDLKGGQQQGNEAALKAALDAAGAKYVSLDAMGSSAKQASDINDLVAAGANALIVAAQDAAAVMPAVQKALEHGVPVIAYDKIINNSKVLYVGYDAREVGRLQAQAMLNQAPTGNYVLMKGSGSDPNNDLTFAGQSEILRKVAATGKIKIVGESYADNWSPANAQKEMEQFLTVNNNKVDAVLAPSDASAGGVVAALAASGLAGQVAVAGEGASSDALNRIALGTQTMSVWKDSRSLAISAAKAAVDLAKGRSINDIAGVSSLAINSQGTSIPSVLLRPISITRQNLDVVVDAGWISPTDVCQGAGASNVVACSSEFWPPPKASAMEEVPSEFFVSSGQRMKTLGEVADWIDHALKEADYHQRTFFPIPAGFAMVTSVEKINDDGTPVANAERWVGMDASLPPPKSFSEYIKALFRGPSGRYRIIAFMVTSQPFSQSPHQVTAAEAGGWLQGGLDRLPSEVRKLQFSGDHVCTALIYEFKKTDNAQAALLVPGLLQAQQHLEAAKLWKDLQP